MVRFLQKNSRISSPCDGLLPLLLQPLGAVYMHRPSCSMHGSTVIDSLRKERLDLVDSHLFRMPPHQITHTLLLSIAQIPHSLFKEDGYDHREALFGVPPYGGSIATNLFYADSDLCDQNVDTHKGYPTRPIVDGKMESWPSPFILMVDRGGCTFVKKVSVMCLDFIICIFTRYPCLTHHSLHRSATPNVLVPPVSLSLTPPASVPTRPAL